MKTYEKFLFVYGIIVSTVIGLGSLFFAPRPQNFAVLLLFIPIILYFWLRLSSPADVSSSKWSLRLIAIVFILGAMGIFAFSLSQKQVVDEKAKQSLAIQSESLKKIEELNNQLRDLAERSTGNEDISDELNNIKDELAALKESDKTKVGGIDPSLLGALDNLEDVAMGAITITKSTVKELDVLETPAFSAKAVGKIEYGTNYEFFEKDATWYLIKLADGKQGWVNSRDVKEVTTDAP